MRRRTDRGQVATYFRSLRASPKFFGIRDRREVGSPRARQRNAFSIQSVSKVFTLTLALGMAGTVYGEGRAEPSGAPSNSSSSSSAALPRNPFINAAHAVTTSSSAGTSRRGARGNSSLPAVSRRRPSISIDKAVAASEQRTGFATSRLPIT